MNCKQFQSKLHGHLDAKESHLPDPLREHALNCKECGDLLEFWKEFNRAGFAPLQSVDDQHWKLQEISILSKISNAKPVSSERHFLPLVGIVSSCAIACCLLILVNRFNASGPPEPHRRGSIRHKVDTRAIAMRKGIDPVKKDVKPLTNQLDEDIVRTPIISINRRRPDSVPQEVIPASKPHDSPAAHVSEPSFAVDDSERSIRIIEVAHTQGPDGKERIGVRPVPVIVINPFVSQGISEGRPESERQ